MPLLTAAAVSLVLLQSAGERIAAEEQARLEACLAKTTCRRISYEMS